MVYEKALHFNWLIFSLIHFHVLFYYCVPWFILLTTKLPLRVSFDLNAILLADLRISDQSIWCKDCSTHSIFNYRTTKIQQNWMDFSPLFNLECLIVHKLRSSLQSPPSIQESTMMSQSGTWLIRGGHWCEMRHPSIPGLGVLIGWTTQ